MIKHFKTSTLKDYMSLAGELGMLEGKARTDNMLREWWEVYKEDTCVVWAEDIDGTGNWKVTDYNKALSEGKIVTVYTTDDVLPNDLNRNDTTSNDMRIYHVETQEDYDDLMIKLEEQGYKWVRGGKPTSKPQHWGKAKEDTLIFLNTRGEGIITRGSSYTHTWTYPHTTIIKHKSGDILELETNKADKLSEYADNLRELKEDLANNKEMYRSIINELEQTYIAKNKDYGNSFEESLDEYGEVAGLVRIGDKLNRAKNLSKNKANVIDESKIDTYLDMANYCIMQAMWLMKKES